MELEWIDIEDNKQRIIASFEIMQYLGDILNIYMSRKDDFPLRLAIQRCLAPEFFFILLKYIREKGDDPFLKIPLSQRGFSMEKQISVNNLVLAFLGSSLENIEIPDYLDGFISGIDKESYLAFVKTMDEISLKIDNKGNLQDAIASVLSNLLEGR